MNFSWLKTSPLAVSFPCNLGPYHEARPVSIIVGCGGAVIFATGGACSASGELGTSALGGISRGKVCACGSSMDRLSVRGSGGKTALVDIARLGPSEMMPQP